MFELGFYFRVQLRENTLGQFFAQLASPLAEGVDVPDGALGENAVFVEGDEFAECFRCEPLGKNRIGRTIAMIFDFLSAFHFSVNWLSPTV